MTSESAEIRLKRLKLRSIRRGIREMDLILGSFAQTRLAGLSANDLDAFEALLEENDHDLLGWITGQHVVPERHAPMIELLVQDARIAAQNGRMRSL